MERMVTGLFDNYEDAVQAVAQLERIGIAQDAISLAVGRSADQEGPSSGLTTFHATEAGLATGTVLGGGAGLLAGLGMMAIPGVGPVVAAGWLVATLAGAGVGAAAGGLAGALMGVGVSQDEANLYAEGICVGGTLVSALVEEDQVPAARAVLGLDRGQRTTDPEAGPKAVATREGSVARPMSSATMAKPVGIDSRQPRG